MAKMAVERRKLLMSLILPQCADIAACEYPVEVEMRLRFHEQSSTYALPAHTGDVNYMKFISHPLASPHQAANTNALHERDPIL
jgi:hypothetical protein